MLLENSKTQTSLQTHAHIAYIGMNAFLIKAFICRLARREEREGSSTANNYKIVATTVMIVHCRELKRVVNPRKGSTPSSPVRFLGGFFWVQMCIPLAPMHYNHLGLQIRLVDAVSKRLLRQFS